MKTSPNTANPESQWFGYDHVAPEEKTARVGRVFSSVANDYDLMNDLMSCGLHRLWKDKFIRRLRPQKGQTILDVAGGTADIALRIADKTEGDARIIVSDINPDMLAVGRDKAVDRGWIGAPFEWVVANAEALPFPDRSMDLVTIVFGLRNVTRIDTALGEFYRVLKPGGRFLCMEFTPTVHPMIKGAYDTYSFAVLPFLGRVVAEDEGAYRYLAESIRQFPASEDFAARMDMAGFDCVRFDSIMGGVAAIHEGWRI